MTRIRVTIKVAERHQFPTSENPPDADPQEFNADGITPEAKQEILDRLSAFGDVEKIEWLEHPDDNS